MEDCIFCKIVEGKSTSYKIYDDDKFYGFLDIYPASKGHVLLIPKKHHRWVHDVENFSEYWEKALKIKKALDKAFKPEWVQYLTHGVIPHAHIHIIPRYDKIDFLHVVPKQGVLKFTKEEMEETKEKITKAIVK